MSAEKKRLKENTEREKHWRRWGPYLSARQWGTVREDYSSDGSVWESFPFQDSAYRAYKWGEDGIGGICDNHCRLCFSFAFWNYKDPILKERFFGLGPTEGNHGEDVKEVFYYLDNTPTHSYMQFLYKYPQLQFPYKELIEKNQGVSKENSEFELADTGIFDEGRYFDIEISYAKQDVEDLFIRIEVTNRSNDVAKLALIPTLWFRNTWAGNPNEEKPVIVGEKEALVSMHPSLGSYFLYFQESPEPIFTENATNEARSYGTEKKLLHTKEAFHFYVIEKQKNAISSEKKGTKGGLVYRQEYRGGETKTLYFRLTNKKVSKKPLDIAEKVFAKRKKEADSFYKEIIFQDTCEELIIIQRRAFAGLLWNKAFYNYIVEQWIHDAKRSPIRNQDWTHVHSEDILSVPDKWEYPAFYSWDTAFQSLPMAMIDPEFAKKQLHLLTREWYMHPSGKIPAYEWCFSDVNPPVHAWATWRVYKIEKKVHGVEDRLFLERVFQKLLLNFTWWVNRKDIEEKNIFQGGFLGLDNISIFNRSEQIPGAKELYQSDATSWMGMYCLNMLAIALELAEKNEAYEDLASKFFEHFVYISEAINYCCDGRTSLWDEEDGFYYDHLKLSSGEDVPLKIRSMVGLVPLFAVNVLNPAKLKRFKGFTKRLNWFVEHRGGLRQEISEIQREGVEGRRILSIVTETKLRRILEKMLDENEFLSPYGIRSLSKYHKKNPYVIEVDSKHYTVTYEPAEAETALFGGNSNWRGPIWFPLNMLLIESLQKYHHFYGESFKVECPTGSGNYKNLWEVAGEISKRLISLFERNQDGKRPIYGENALFQNDAYFKDQFLFHEYFNADTGEGLGAAHQTGWTALIAKLIRQSCQYKSSF